MLTRHALSPASQTILLLAALLSWAATAPAEEAETPPGKAIVARVDGQTITQTEFEDGLRMAAQQRARMASMAGKTAQGFLTDEQRKQVLEGMIDAKVLGILAGKSKIEVPDSAVEEELEALKGRSPSQEAFENSLKEKGLTTEDLAQRIREQLLMRSFVQEKTKDITASEQEVAAAYETGKSKSAFDTVDVAHILMKVQSADEKDWEEAKKRIDTARKRIVDGEDFAAVAKEVSEDPGSAKNGGLFPNTPRGRMTPQFEEIAFSIPIGELSEPFRTEYGWHILKVSAHGQIPLEDVAPRIAKELTRDKRRAELKRIVDEAKSTMKIEVNTPAASAVETPSTAPVQTPPAEAPKAGTPESDQPLPNEPS